MTVIAIHQPIGTAGILAPLTARFAAWRQRHTKTRMARQAAAANTGQITIAEFLQRLGADDATIRQVDISLGKAVANAYRAATGTEPEQSGLALVRGRIFPVNAYGWNRLELIFSVAVTFPAVAALIGA